MVSYTYNQAFFYLSVWLIGQSGWKFCSTPSLTQIQFLEVLAGNCKILLIDEFF